MCILTLKISKRLSLGTASCREKRNVSVNWRPASANKVVDEITSNLLIGEIDGIGYAEMTK
ncbi:MAG: hypothetical protein AAF719_08205 [Pseudomonadota bacterium]